jgi:phage replication O-like protein O
MVYKQTTQVPNFIFDHYLAELPMAELKVLLVIIRQTLGWMDMKTGQRKARDRISHSQFMTKTGLSRRSIITAIQSLQQRKMITITDTCHSTSAKNDT